MNGKRFLLLGLAGALLVTAAARAEAKDVFYYLGDEVVQVIDGSTDAIVANIPVKGWSREVILTPDKKFMYLMTNRHLIHKLDLAENKVVATIDVNQDGWERFIFGFCLGPDDKSAYVGMMSRRTEGGEVVIGKPVVAQIDLATGKILRSLEVPWGVARLVPVKGSSWVYAIGKDLYKIDASGPEMKIAETYPMFAKQMNFLPFWDYVWENGGVFMANYYTPERMGLLSIDTATGEIKDIPLKGDPAFAYSVIFSPDKKKAYGAMDDLTVIDVEKRTYIASVPNQQGTCYGINVSSDGKKIYMGAGGSTLTIYDAKTLKPIKVLQMASDGMDIRRVTY